MTATASFAAPVVDAPPPAPPAWGNRLAIALLLLSLGALAHRWLGPAAPADAAVEVLRPGPFEVTVRTVGDLVPAHRRLVAAPFSAKVAEMAPEGAVVKAGAVVARLETADLDERLADADQKLDQLAQAAEVRDLTATREQARQRIAVTSAGHDVDLAALLLKQAVAGTPAAELADLQLRAVGAKQALVHERAQHAVRQELLGKGILRPVDVRQGEVALARAVKADAVAAAALALARRGTPARRLAVRRLALEVATSKRTLAVEKLAFLQRTAAMAKAVDDAEVAYAKVRRSEHAHRIAAARLLAPADGVVVYNAVYVRGGGLRKLQVGDEARENWAFMEVADVGHVRVKTRVREVDLARVQVGMAARLVATGVADVLPGRLASLGVLAAELPDAVNREGAPRVFEAWVDTDRSSAAFRPGMSVDVTFVARTWPHELSVPAKAVVREAGGAVAWVRRPGGAVEKRAIATAERAGDRLRVVAGLEAGDAVLVEPPGQPGEDGP